jgi:hypothetical protein
MSPAMPLVFAKQRRKNLLDNIIKQQTFSAPKPAAEAEILNDE